MTDYMVYETKKERAKQWKGGYNVGYLDGLDKADKIITKIWDKTMERWDKAHSKEKIEKSLRIRLEKNK